MMDVQYAINLSIIPEVVINCLRLMDVEIIYIVGKH